MTENDVLDFLRAKCRDAGSQTAWSDANGFTKEFLSAVLHRKRRCSARMLDALGLERVASVTYREKAP